MPSTDRATSVGKLAMASRFASGGICASHSIGDSFEDCVDLSASIFDLHRARFGARQLDRLPRPAVTAIEHLAARRDPCRRRLRRIERDRNKCIEYLPIVSARNHL
jgi:hypothetical protein